MKASFITLFDDNDVGFTIGLHVLPDIIFVIELFENAIESNFSASTS